MLKAFTLLLARRDYDDFSLLSFSFNMNTTSQNNYLRKATRCILWITGNLSKQNQSTLAVLSKPVEELMWVDLSHTFPHNVFLEI